MYCNIQAKKLFTISAVVLLLMIGSFSSASAAQPTLPPAPPQATIPTCSFTDANNIDGEFTLTEWAGAFTIPMYEAGKADHTQIGIAYLFYNPSSQMMYVAVQLDSTVVYLSTASWVRIDSAQHAPVSFIAGPTTAGNGYEASFYLPIQHSYTIIVHAQCKYTATQKEATAATLEFEGVAGTPIFVAPEYLYGGLAALGACIVAFVVVKHKSLPNLVFK